MTRVASRIDLSLGDPSYPPPPEAIAATLFALRSAHFGYGPPGGLLKLRELIAAKLMTKKGIPADPSRILVTAGASMGLYAVLAALLKSGDPVMCPDPGYPPYANLVRRLGGVPVYYQLAPDQGFRHNVVHLENALPSSCSVVIWNSPANPVGSVATEATTRKLIKLVEDRKLWLISDEAYEDLIYEGSHVSPVPFDNGNNVVSLSSFSKSYALSGWRVGYAIVPSSLYQRVQQAHWEAAMSPSTPSQYAAIGALHAPDSYLESVRLRLSMNRDVATAVLAEHGVYIRKPGGGFFLWIDIRPTARTSEEFCALCWDRASVLLSPGTAFGPSGVGHVRLSFATSEEVVREGAQRVGEFYHSLRQERVSESATSPYS